MTFYNEVHCTIDVDMHEKYRLVLYGNQMWLSKATQAHVNVLMVCAVLQRPIFTIPLLN